MVLRILSLVAVFQITVFANSCPKWAPIAVDDIFTIVPIYPYPTTAPDMDCDGVSDADERERGTDPRRRDTDDDGVGDYEDDYPRDARRSRDVTAPVITLRGDRTLVVYRYSKYTDAGATAVDDRDGSVRVAKSGRVNTYTPGTYRLTYVAIDAKGNRAVTYRTVVVKPEVRPQLVVDYHSPADNYGGRPSMIVKQFIDAFVSGSKARVSELVGDNQRILDMLYSNAAATGFLKNIYKNTFEIRGGHQSMGDASVTISFVDNGHPHQGGFELSRAKDNRWIITFIY